MQLVTQVFIVSARELQIKAAADYKTLAWILQIYLSETNTFTLEMYLQISIIPVFKYLFQIGSYLNVFMSLFKGHLWTIYKCSLLIILNILPHAPCFTLVCLWWLTFILHDDSFLRNGWACSSACSCTQIKLVAWAVLEVFQSDRGLIGSQGQLLFWAQFIGVIDYRDEGRTTTTMGCRRKLGSRKLCRDRRRVRGCRWSLNNEKGENLKIWITEE